MRSFNENENLENILPEERARVEEEVKRARLLRLYSKHEGEDTTAFIEIITDFGDFIGKDLLNEDGEKLMALLKRLHRDGTPWMFNIYCDYVLDFQREATTVANKYGIKPSTVCYHIDRVNDIFENK